MFEALSDRLDSAWKSLRGQDKISESNVNDALKEGAPCPAGSRRKPAGR